MPNVEDKVRIFLCMTFSKYLLKILAELERTFHPDELAYLAATGKIEGPIRDRIAFGLHSQIKKDFFVHREWNSQKGGWTDIAVTDVANHPKYLIELKAHSGPTFEGVYSKHIAKDLKKMYLAGERDTELYLIFLFNHLYHPMLIDQKYEHAIKYFKLQNFGLRNTKFSPDVSSVTKKHWEDHLVRIGLLLNASHPGIRINAGNYHSMAMSVYAYVYGPVFRLGLTKVLSRIEANNFKFEH
ncbi:hypothetical protein ACQ86N_00105 [Puia sp. P3]|uniref:hypothetical protein n=1 Tax=Puia sp. P3 TaxID=3423952 RepID=UPI003D670174